MLLPRYVTAVIDLNRKENHPNMFRKSFPSPATVRVDYGTCVLCMLVVNVLSVFQKDSEDEMGNDRIAALMIIQVNLKSITAKTLRESAATELKGSIIGNE